MRSVWMGRGSGRRWSRCLGLGVLAALLSGCMLPSGELGQGGDLPSLRHLEWGYPYYGEATWSPDGQWIALLAGPGPGLEHFVVLSPDGRTRHDLTAWGCTESGILSFAPAWLPDSSLGCLTKSGKLVIDTAPFQTPITTPTTVPLGLYPSVDGGATWTADGTQLIVTSITDPTDPVHHAQHAVLYVVSRTGTVTLRPLTAPSHDIQMPRWVPHQPALSYWVETDPSTGIGDLVLSTVSADASGQMVLGPPRTLAVDVDQAYAWSPSGRWVAVRHSDYRGGDKIYLVNAQHPTQTVDVLLADRVGQQMMAPIWSPDGNTLIVFSVAYGSSQPYALAIGAYLRGKHLQP